MLKSIDKHVIMVIKVFILRGSVHFTDTFEVLVGGDTELSYPVIFNSSYYFEFDILRVCICIFDYKSY